MGPTPKKEKILIIEANIEFGERLKDAVTKEGYTVTLHVDGAEGIKAMYDIMPHLLMVDVVLPGATGYEILGKKASEPLLSKIPVFLLSTQGIPINMALVPQNAVKEFILDLHADAHEITKKVNALFGYADSDAAKPVDPNNAKKVLWVEDDKLIGTILGKKLISSGFNLFHARNGEEAVEMLRTMTPDVIVLDLLMPGMTGFDVLQKVKSIDSLKKIPVMILSNLNKQSDIERAKNMGAQRFFVKAAISLDGIVTEVRNLCSSQESVLIMR